MNNIFAMDIQSEEAQTYDGAVFLLREGDPELFQRALAANEQVQAVVQRGNLPRWVVFLRSGSLFLGVFLGALSVRYLGQSLSAQYFWVYLFAALLFLGVFLGLNLYALRRQRSVGNDPDYQIALTRLKQAEEACYDGLGVPRTAETADLFVFPYALRKGQRKPGIPVAEAMTAARRVFVENGALCIADLEQVYALPLSAISRIRTHEKRLRSYGWCKEVLFNQPPYQAYRITGDSYGCIHLKSYCSVELEYGEDSWEFFFPPYEHDVYARLTGIPLERWE